MSTTLVHVGVRASDLEATIRFWRDGLGLPVFSQQGNCYDLSDGFHNFRVFQHNGPARPAHVSGMLDYLHIGIRVPDLEVAARRLWSRVSRDQKRYRGCGGVSGVGSGSGYCQPGSQNLYI